MYRVQLPTDLAVILREKLLAATLLYSSQLHNLVRDAKAADDEVEGLKNLLLVLQNSVPVHEDLLQIVQGALLLKAPSVELNFTEAAITWSKRVVVRAMDINGGLDFRISREPDFVQQFQAMLPKLNELRHALDGAVLLTKDEPAVENVKAPGGVQ